MRGTDGKYTWREAEDKYRFAGAEFNEERAKAYNNFAARRLGHIPRPVKLVTSIEYGFLGTHGSVIRVATNQRTYGAWGKIVRRQNEELWRTMVHEVAHYVDSGHRSGFIAASRKAYDLWWEFAPTQEGWLRKRGRKAKRVEVNLETAQA